MTKEEELDALFKEVYLRDAEIVEEWHKENPGLRLDARLPEQKALIEETKKRWREILERYNKHGG